MYIYFYNNPKSEKKTMKALLMIRTQLQGQNPGYQKVVITVMMTTAKMEMKQIAIKAFRKYFRIIRTMGIRSISLLGMIPEKVNLANMLNIIVVPSSQVGSVTRLMTLLISSIII